LVARVRRGKRAGPAAVPPDVRILDGAFLRVSLRLAPWLDLAPPAAVQLALPLPPAPP